MTQDQKTLLLAIWLTNQHSWPYLRIYKPQILLIRSHIHTLTQRLAESGWREDGTRATWEEAVAEVVTLAMGQPHPILAKWAADRQAVPEMAITWDNTFRTWKPEPGDPCYHRKHFEARVAANTQAIWLALEMEEMSDNDKSNNDQWIKMVGEEVHILRIYRNKPDYWACIAIGEDKMQAIIRYVETGEVPVLINAELDVLISSADLEYYRNQKQTKNDNKRSKS
jgi:hypothetical protein